MTELDLGLSQRYKKRAYDILELTDPEGTSFREREKKSAPRKGGRKELVSAIDKGKVV